MHLSSMLELYGSCSPQAISVVHAFSKNAMYTRLDENGEVLAVPVWEIMGLYTVSQCSPKFRVCRGQCSLSQHRSVCSSEGRLS